jgi:hypothetical protein
MESKHHKNTRIPEKWQSSGRKKSGTPRKMDAPLEGSKEGNGKIYLQGG